MKTTRRGFLGALAALVAAPAVAVAAAEPKTMHFRFTDSSATKIHWTQESAFIHTDGPAFKKIDMTIVEDDPPPGYDPAYKYWRRVEDGNSDPEKRG